MKSTSKILDALTSQVGRKILTGITGILLALFLIAHVSGNYSLLSHDKTAFNKYGAFLHSFGLLFYAIEIGLGLTILLHAWIGISIWRRRVRARPEGYQVYKSKGGPSRQSISSRTMIVTGSVLLIFIIIHLIQFRFGPGYVQVVDGKEMHDLRRITVETFMHIGWVIFYVGVLVLVAFHLRHGIWSSLQSLGAMKNRWSKPIYTLALVAALLIALSFIVLPIMIYLKGEGV